MPNLPEKWHPCCVRTMIPIRHQKGFPSYRCWESFPSLVRMSSWWQPMSSVFHQSSDACEESVFLGRNISSLESNKRPHYYFAVERVFIAVNTNLNSGQTISECPEDHNNSLHCFTYRNLEAESKAWDYCKEASTTWDYEHQSTYNLLRGQYRLKNGGRSF